jgi:glycosyltransferase involved in cell wall biosynthesis
MKIVIVTETFPPEINGVAMSLKRIVSGLLERGHRVDVVHPQKEQEQNIGYTNIFVRGFKIPMYPDLKIGLCSIGYLIRRWRVSNPDLVHVATEGPLGFVAIRAAIKCGIPVTSSFHTNFHAYTSHYGMDFFKKGLLAYLRYIHNITAHTFVPCLSVQKELEELGFLNVNIMGRGVDSELFDPDKRSDDLRKLWGVQSDTKVILYVGRIAAEKNIELAVQSFRAMQSKEKNIRFVLVGDGPLRLQLEEENPDFYFSGMQRGESLARHYASGDIFLFPSVSETFGNVIMEAMASGLICLSYDYAAAREHLENGVNGFSVRMHEEASFTQVAKDLLEKENLESVRMSARRKAEEISWSSVVDKFEADLLGVVNNWVK